MISTSRYPVISSQLSEISLWPDRGPVGCWRMPAGARSESVIVEDTSIDCQGRVGQVQPSEKAEVELDTCSRTCASDVITAGVYRDGKRVYEYLNPFVPSLDGSQENVN